MNDKPPSERPPSDRPPSERPDYWRSIPEEKWRDWRWQMGHRLTTEDDLRNVLPLNGTVSEELSRCLQRFRMAIPPYFAALVAKDGPGGPLWRQAVVSAAELEERPSLHLDPLNEEDDSPVHGLVHRYPDRVLLLLTDRCAMYCRHCTRRRFAGSHEHDASSSQLDKYLEYLRRHPEVRDVILSGGDPLTLADARLNDFLLRLRAIPSVEIIRVGSRLPITLPYRITDELCRMLEQHHPIFMNIHVNHPDELTPEVREACDRLTRAGIPLGSQTVLLKGVNDDPVTLKKLFQKLLTFRVKPYYLYHCDPAQGTAHFRTPIARGMELIEYLLGHTSGLAVPTYVVDAPHGAGKIPIMPNYVLTNFPGGAVLRNFEGMLVRYVENGVVDAERIPEGVTGVAALACGAQDSLVPVGLPRELRRMKEGPRPKMRPREQARARRDVDIPDLFCMEQE
jgi:lysine 2,3-aminomutase